MKFNWRVATRITLHMIGLLAVAGGLLTGVGGVATWHLGFGGGVALMGLYLLIGFNTSRTRYDEKNHY